MGKIKCLARICLWTYFASPQLSHISRVIQAEKEYALWNKITKNSLYVQHQFIALCCFGRLKWKLQELSHGNIFLHCWISLENALRNFACLSSGDMVAINYNDKVRTYIVMPFKPFFPGDLDKFHLYLWYLQKWTNHILKKYLMKNGALHPWV